MPNPRYANVDADYFDEEDEDWYDANGNPTPNGCYDAGGHFDGERAAEIGDWIRDRIRDERGE